MTMSKKILIITPDPNLGVMIEARLVVEDYQTFLVEEGETGLFFEDGPKAPPRRV